MTEQGGSLFDRLGGRAAIDRLVDEFYGNARKDPVLGPIFASRVHDWPAHLVTVAEFWSTQSGGPRLYQGGMGKHIRLGLQTQHFDRWLSLWEATTLSLFGEKLSAELVLLARRIADHLQEMIRGVSGLRMGPQQR